MSCYKISYKDGHKVASPVNSREEYMAIRGSVQQNETLRLARSGSADAKRRLVQMNYSCLPNEDGTLKGATRVSNSVGMDVDFDKSAEDYEKKMSETPEKILALKDKLGLLMLERSVNKGYHIVFRRHADMTNEENLQWASSLLGIEYDRGAKDITRVFFTTGATNDDLLYLDDALFSPTPAPPQREGESYSLQSSGKDNSQSLEQAESNKAKDSQANGLQKEDQAEDPQTEKVTSPSPLGERAGSGASGALFRGIAYSSIISRLLLAMGVDGKPEEGERNTYLYSLARELRYITDFNVDKILSVLPDWGLPANEVRATVSSAVGSVRSKDIPGELTRIIQALLAEKKAMEESGMEVEIDEKLLLPHNLPRFFWTLIKAYPEEYKEAVLMASLPILGALATRVRSTYLDGSTHSPSFISCIVAPQASGKSFARHLYNLLTEPILAQDIIGREAERIYNEKRKSAKNTKQQPEDPKAVIRLIPATASNATILKRMDYAQHLHLLTFAEELDTLYKSNKAGAWSQKSDIFRMAFDNAFWGQDYMSDNSYSGMVQLYYNLLLCGTPNAMNRFFSDVEDGLVSRVNFITLPDMLGAQMPKFGKYSRKDKEYIRSVCQRLHSPTPTPPQGEGGSYSLQSSGKDNSQSLEQSEGNKAKDSQAKGPQTKKLTSPSPLGERAGSGAPMERAGSGAPELWLDEKSERKLSLAFTAWLEDKRMLYLQNQDNPALDIFRRRAAVIGYRAGMVCWALEGRLSKESIDFSLWVAEKVLHNLLELFGEKMNDTMNKAEEATTTFTNQRQGHSVGLLDQLPQKFHTQDLMNVRMSMGLNGSNVRYIICRWVKNGMIEKIDEHTWIKCG